MHLQRFARRQAGRSAARWLVLIFVLLVAVACGRTIPAAEVDMTPAAGGMAAPADDQAAAGDGEVTAAASERATSSEVMRVEPVVLAVGQRAVLRDPAGVRLRAAAAANAPLLEFYAADAPFEIVEPSGDFEAYPIIVDEQSWYRVRAGDGLVGWIAADVIEVVE